MNPTQCEIWKKDDCFIIIWKQKIIIIESSSWYNQFHHIWFPLKYNCISFCFLSNLIWIPSVSHNEFVRKRTLHMKFSWNRCFVCIYFLVVFTLTWNRFLIANNWIFTWIWNIYLLFGIFCFLFILLDVQLFVFCILTEALGIVVTVGLYVRIFPIFSAKPYTKRLYLPTTLQPTKDKQNCVGV